MPLTGGHHRGEGELELGLGQLCLHLPHHGRFTVDHGAETALQARLFRLGVVQEGRVRVELFRRVVEPLLRRGVLLGQRRDPVVGLLR